MDLFGLSGSILDFGCLRDPLGAILVVHLDYLGVWGRVEEVRERRGNSGVCEQCSNMQRDTRRIWSLDRETNR